jgi:hypothetical protein
MNKFSLIFLMILSISLTDESLSSIPRPNTGTPQLARKPLPGKNPGSIRPERKPPTAAELKTGTKAVAAEEEGFKLRDANRKRLADVHYQAAEALKILGISEVEKKELADALQVATKSCAETGNNATDATDLLAKQNCTNLILVAERIVSKIRISKPDPKALLSQNTSRLNDLKVKVPKLLATLPKDKQDELGQSWSKVQQTCTANKVGTTDCTIAINSILQLMERLKVHVPPSKK